MQTYKNRDGLNNLDANNLKNRNMGSIIFAFSPESIKNNRCGRFSDLARFVMPSHSGGTVACGNKVFKSNTAAGTVPELNRIPFYANEGNSLHHQNGTKVSI